MKASTIYFSNEDFPPMIIATAAKKKPKVVKRKVTTELMYVKRLL